MDRETRKKLKAVAGDLLNQFPIESRRKVGRGHPSALDLYPMTPRIPRELFLAFKCACPDMQSLHIERAIRIYLELLKADTRP